MGEAEELPPSKSVSRRTVAKAIAWSVPAVAVAVAAPVAAASPLVGSLGFTGAGCKLPGNATVFNKGDAFALQVTNPTSADIVIHIDSVKIGTSVVPNVTVVQMNGTCTVVGTTFTIPANTTTPLRLALIMSNYPNSANRPLTVSYTRDGVPQTANATTDSVPPMPGAEGQGSCPLTTFNLEDRACLLSLIPSL